MKPPKTDPTKSARLILSYQKEMKVLVNRYTSLVKRSIKIAYGEPVDPLRSMEAPTGNREDLLYQSIPAISAIVVAAASGIVSKMVIQQYVKGDAWAQSTIPPPLRGPDLQVGISFNLPVARETVARLQTRQNAAFVGMTDEMAKKTIQQLTEGIQRGEGVPQLTKRISEVADIGYARAETIARTETMNAVNQGAIDRYKQTGFTQLEWLAALDERTCTRAIEWMGKTYAGCGGLNGQVFDIDKFPQLPAHPNCRCTSIPVMAVKA